MKKSELYTFIRFVTSDRFSKKEQTVKRNSLLVRDISSIMDSGGEEEVVQSRFHNPKNMVEFLEKFTKDENFKWFTHSPQDKADFNYENYLNSATQVLYETLKTNKINFKTYTNVINFIGKDSIINAKNYLGKPIKLKWSDFKEWCNNNNQAHPYFELKDDVKFSSCVEEFKSTIQIRTDSPFSNMFADFIVNDEELSDEIKNGIEFTDSYDRLVDSINVFVDLRQLFFAFKKVFRWINDNKVQGTRVVVDLKETDEGNAYEFTIHHIGSKLRVNDDKIKGLSGDFLSVRDSLFSVADWIIETDRYVNGKLSSVTISCLDNNTESKCLGPEEKWVIITPNVVQEINDSPGGVKHIFRIYKK